MICAIRIHGMVGLNKDVVETLYRLRLRKKYSCIVLEKPTKEQLGMIKKVRDFVAFGEINEETYKELKEKRGKMQGTKSPTSSPNKSGTKDIKGNLKPFFRLHPPRKGIDSKKHFGVKKGVLGNNKEKINELVLRML
jgi:large subunit ribosomal protein L30